MIRGVIQYQGSAWAKAKELRAIAKTALAATVVYWHQKMLPEHFKTKAPNDYAYQKRNAEYMRRKARQKHHQRPLVWSGNLERMVSRAVRVSSTSKGARGVLTGPKYLYMYRKDYKQPDKAAEITAVNEADIRALAAYSDRLMTRDLNNIRTRETRAIG